MLPPVFSIRKNHEDADGDGESDITLLLSLMLSLMALFSVEVRKSVLIWLRY